MCHTPVSPIIKIRYSSQPLVCDNMEPPCKTLVKQLYEEVVQDVIQNLQEDVAEEGIDQDVIHELKRIWESKILATKAISPAHQPQNHADDNRTVPVQIVLPAQPQGNAKQNVLIVHVPAFALQSNQLYNVLSGPLISATMSLPQPLAASVLQQHMNAAFMSRRLAGNSMVNKAAAPTGPEFSVNCFKGAMKGKSVEVQSKPSTSGVNQKNSHRQEKEDGMGDEDNLYKSKKKKMKRAMNNE